MRYFLRAVAFALVRGSRIRPRYIGVLAGRAVGGWLARWIAGRH
jgi:hypothetical protein